VPLIAINSTLRLLAAINSLNSTLIIQTINQAPLLALFVVEWIDAKIMDGGYGYPFFIGLTSSNGIAGGSGGGRCGEGGGVNILQQAAKQLPWRQRHRRNSGNNTNIHIMIH
jgi:hypothetical protein